MSPKWKNILHLSSAMLVFVSVLFYSKWSYADMKCQRIEIDFNNKLLDQSFLVRKDVIDMLYEKDFKLVGKQIKALDQEKLEAFLENNPHCKNVEVYTSLDGISEIAIEEKQALLRCFDNKVSYYLDLEGNYLPLSKHYYESVLVVSGNIKFLKNKDLKGDKLEFKEELIEMAHFIRTNELWDAQIQQLNVDENLEVVVIPRLGNHNIELGKIYGFKEKLAKLEIFYREGLKYTGWGQYSNINLRFKNQVVCTKK